MSTATIKIYNILKHKFSEEEAEEIVGYLEAVPKEGFATREDLLAVKQELKEDIFGVKDSLKESISKLDKKFTIYFIVLLAVIFLINPRSIELIGKMLGIAR